MSDAELAAFQSLSPGAVLDAVESTGRSCAARLLALNSYENRVYRVGLEQGDNVVAKFYRPRRWSDETILEEHEFTLELAAAELPVLAPLSDDQGRTLFRHGEFRFALYPSRGGQWPELEREEQYQRLGRALGRMHAMGALRPFRHRGELGIGRLGEESLRFLIAERFLPADLEEAYRSLGEDLLERVRAAFDRAGPYPAIRLHGDFHRGNILWSENAFVVLDFDDCCAGPAVQDLWMLLAGERAEMARQLGWLLEGYGRFHDFDARQLHLVEALRTLRMLHYSAWLARRWTDPAFPLHFPWFNTQRYWQDQILALREQAALLEEPPLEWR